MKNQLQQCKKKGCYSQKQEEDKHFCYNCRENFKRWLNRNSILHPSQYTIAQEETLIKTFQGA